MTQQQRDEIVRLATNNTYLNEIDLNKFGHPNYYKRIKKIIDMNPMEFFDRHKKNGGDLSKWDGTVPKEETEQRKPNPDLKQYNYKFVKNITVIDAEIINFVK